MELETAYLRSQGVVTRLFHRRKFSVIFFGLFIAVLISLFTTRSYNKAYRPPYRLPIDRGRPSNTHSYEHAEDDIHLLIPATEASVDLCKCIYTALVLGYPTPTLINWDAHIWDADLAANGTHLAKISGVLEYMDRLREDAQDHLVVVVDGYDSWFQLRPDALRSRYRSVNTALMARTKSMIGSAAVRNEDLSQSILFSVQKNCGPGKSQWDEPACYAQPESSLRPDLYGPDTDTTDPDKHLPLHMRPHFLNSGLIIGPVSDMQSMLRRAEQKISQTYNNGEDQYIFNEIYGEQEYQREVMRLRHQSLLAKLGNGLKNLIGIETPSVTDGHHLRSPMPHLDGHPLDYGIGLDYGMEISQSAVLSEFDGRFFTFDDTLQQQIEGQADIPDPTRIRDIPPDVRLSYPQPFERMIPPAQVEKFWWDVPLWTNIWTGSVPVTLHMNGFKSMRDHIWDKMWFFARAEDLLRGVEEPGVKDDSGKFIPWSNICQRYERQLFRDP